MWIAIGWVAKQFGVTTQTIRNWTQLGKLHVQRTLGRHRRYSLEEVENLRGEGKPVEEKTTLIYSRVSSHDQKEDLVRQTEELREYCQANQFQKVKIIEDIGSGINYKNED